MDVPTGEHGEVMTFLLIQGASREYLGTRRQGRPRPAGHGFLGPRKPGVLDQAGMALDPRRNVAANVQNYRTSVPKLFSAEDIRGGQSLVVRAIREGRQCARSLDDALIGETSPPL